MVSNQRNCAKLAEVAILSAATFTLSLTFAVAETIIRAVPSTFILLGFYISGKKEDVTEADLLYLGTGPFLSAFAICDGLNLSIDMLKKPELFLYGKL